MAAPDSDTRVDSEVLNDSLHSIVNIETTLGGGVNGQFASVAARLNQFLPGGGRGVTIEAFAADTQWVLPGTRHSLATPVMLLYAYDGQDPAHALDPGDITVDPTTYDITMNFGMAQSGLLVATLGIPSYSTTFTNQTTLIVPGGTHQLGTTNVCWQVRDTTGQVVVPGAVTIHPSTRDVTVQFTQAQTGRLVLGVPLNVSSTAFTSQTQVTVTGATHGLASRALCWQVWSNATPNAWVEPASVTVDPDTFTVVVTFAQAQSGRLVLGKAVAVTGTDFQILDGGIVDQTAVRVFSNAGKLYLQHGSGDATEIRSKTGGTLVTVNNTGQVGLGVTPTHQLHLSTDDAAKLATATWATTSDARLKDVLRPYTDGLDLLRALEPIWYRYNGLGGIPRDRKEYVGLLAQAVQAVAPYMVSSRRGRLRDGEEETELLELQSAPLLFALINAVNDLAGQVAALTAQVAARPPPPSPQETTP